MNLQPVVKTDNLDDRCQISLENGKLIDVTIDCIYEVIRDIKDPEHSFTLEQLNVVRKESVKFCQYTKSENYLNLGLPINVIEVSFEPTIPHCSMAAIIGLSIKYILGQVTSKHLIKVMVKEGSHLNDMLINKQLNDKDRVQAAYENEALMDVITSCLASTMNKLAM